jgi:hypothetical protein
VDRAPGTEIGTGTVRGWFRDQIEVLYVKWKLLISVGILDWKRHWRELVKRRAVKTEQISHQPPRKTLNRIFAVSRSQPAKTKQNSYNSHV